MATEFQFSPTFLKGFEKLKPEIKKAAVSALNKFKETPQAKSLRFHRLSSVKPPVWKIDIFTDHSWQIAMRVEGETCILLSVDTHKNMDRRY